MKAYHTVQAGPDHIRTLSWRGFLFWKTLKRLCYPNKTLIGAVGDGVGYHIRVSRLHTVGLAHEHQAVEFRLFLPETHIGASHGLQGFAAT